jgi:UDP-N-acetylglucosamine/UDP-N-acetylgalactosamine diphosphorylase
MKPIKTYHKSGNASLKKVGRELVSQGKVACLVVAGGEGTRLGFEGPKGAYPISVVKQKSLFQLLAQKVLAASKQAGKALMLAVMTSPSNHKQTKEILSKLLPKEQLFIFKQSTLPFLTEEGKPFSKGPDGNGKALHHLVESKILEKWKMMGVEIVNFTLIDNPLADPFDFELAALLHQTGADVCMKCILKQSNEEKVGLVVEKENKVQVVEYSEIDGVHDELTIANLSLFAFSVPFIERISKEVIPAHKAWKKTLFHGKEKMGFKQEYFIFDLLPFSKKTEVILYPREECFAPLKNKVGDASPETVKAALQAQDKKIFEMITGKAPKEGAFELSQEFYYPTKELLTKWRGKESPGGYVEA